MGTRPIYKVWLAVAPDEPRSTFHDAPGSHGRHDIGGIGAAPLAMTGMSRAQRGLGWRPGLEHGLDRTGSFIWLELASGIERGAGPAHRRHAAGAGLEPEPPGIDSRPDRRNDQRGMTSAE